MVFVNLSLLVFVHILFMWLHIHEENEQRISSFQHDFFVIYKHKRLHDGSN